MNAYYVSGTSVTKEEIILILVKTILGGGANNKFYSVLESDRQHKNVEQCVCMLVPP